VVKKISITFDCDEGYAPSRFQRYLSVRRDDVDARKYLAAFTVAEPKIYASLQAADLLAWEIRKDLLRQIGGYEVRTEFQNMMSILPGFPPDYEEELWSEEKLEKQFGPLTSAV
jgi:hypothetical protein